MLSKYFGMEQFSIVTSIERINYPSTTTIRYDMYCTCWPP